MKTSAVISFTLMILLWVGFVLTYNELHNHVGNGLKFWLLIINIAMTWVLLVPIIRRNIQ